MNEPYSQPLLKLLVIIIEPNQTDKVDAILQKSKLHFHFECDAIGTAPSEILDVLGIGRTEKRIVFCLESVGRIQKMIARLHADIYLDKPGHGIAFTLPLSGVSNPVCGAFAKKLEEEAKGQPEKEVEKMKFDAKFDLIMAVLNQGYSDDLMEAAKKAGATGGTILNARHIGAEKAVKFFGISIQAEKEVVWVLAARENKKAIMQGMSQACGAKTDAQGVVFSLPVDHVEGLFSETEEGEEE